MKVKFTLKKIFFVAIIGFSSPVLAQFNTLAHSSIKTKEILTKNEELKIGKNEKEENAERKQTKKNFRNTTTKADLKNEIDSLKNMMIRFGLSKNEKLKINFKKFEDSLLQITKENMVNTTQNRSSNTFQKLDFIEEEPGRNYKIFMPVKKQISISSSFGRRTHPIFGNRKMHNGADFKANYENVYSVLDGIVTESGWDSKGGGNYIKIKHFNRFETSYLHLSQIYYKVGEYVKAGFIIAKSGNSGNSTGPHLHFGVKEYGNFINPIYFLNDLVKANNLMETY
ncbi:M23 family metallopeptidase [Chryseobacterium salivictor]|uniref:Murein DD-endopeptidase MepM n=1 Tax=Chryseobacterium salivictor TaxID=2547600 RepID=A0A4P6ZJ04_9FLAO|nr:M23 family metallopeptidase [Chryseobacterium salivictor]QBO59527.1 Murein DD-endopeptidase MepM [Chryseobacterium salivictor]